MWWFLCAGLVLAQQTRHEARGGSQVLQFSEQSQNLRPVAKPEAQLWIHMGWTDDTGKAQEVRFSLNQASVDADRAAGRLAMVTARRERLAEVVRTYSKTLPDGVAVTVEDGVLRPEYRVVGASTTAQHNEVVAGANRVMRQAMAEFRKQHGYVELWSGLYGPDLAGFAVEYRDDLSSLASALAEGTTTQLEYINRTLHFVQTIPYEVVRRHPYWGGTGYRRPLALLADNAGDCDSKAVLFLALVGARYPQLPACIIYIKGHVYVGLGLDRPTGATLEHRGQRYTLIEAVGPRQAGLGELGKGSIEKPVQFIAVVPTR